VTAKSFPILGSSVITKATYLESMSDPFSAMDVPCVESSITVLIVFLARGTSSTLRNLNSNFEAADVSSPDHTKYQSSSTVVEATLDL
jgi:hypothetical protein